MNDSSTPSLMQLLAGQMRYMSARQRVLADNVANIDTPSYRARDLKKLDFAGMVQQETGGGVQLAATSPKHFAGGSGKDGTFKTEVVRKPFEVSPTGNGVVLEEQMAKISDTGVSYEVASTLYKKFTQLYRAALGQR